MTPLQEKSVQVCHLARRLAGDDHGEALALLTITTVEFARVTGVKRADVQAVFDQLWDAGERGE